MTDLTWKIRKIAKPGDRYVKIDYYPSGNVKAVYEPLETQDPIKRYEFCYHKHWTDVFNALDQLTRYHFDDHQRLTRISYFDGGNSIRQDHFEWSTREGQEGWLRSKSIRSGEDIHYLKTLRYDARGNITTEALYGNLTGEKPETFKISNKTQMDRAPIYHVYYPDGRNLLKETSTPEGLHITYHYHPKTNLCTKTLCRYEGKEGKILERTFCSYDDNGELKTLIEDDGSSEDPANLKDVHYRKIKRVTAVSEHCAAFGKPEKIKESYLDETGEEISLQETLISYDAKGCETTRKIFDSKGLLCFTTTKSYDEKLLLRSETNPLGHTIHYNYDDNRNKIEEELIGSGKKVHYKYDFCNRLSEKKEMHEDGKIFTTTYVYNSLDQLIEETNPYHQKTTYRYDRLGNEIACIKPLIQDGNGSILSPTFSKKYNALNQVIEETDENGYTTRYSYNIYGTPTEITHPDGSKERFIYYPCGWLKEKRHADGTSISYKYDAKGHLLNETFLDKNGTQVKSLEYVYRGPLLQSKKDNRGLLITYEYDGTGRKIKEIIGGLKTIHYSYDDFGRLIRREESGRVELIEYDGLDRPISKILKDAQNKVFAEETYAYDIQGNQTKKTVSQTQERAAAYTSEYYSDGRLHWEENPLHHRTSWEYDHNRFNALGQQVQERTIRDPLNRVTKELYDSHHRLAAHKIYDGEKLVSSTELYHDAAGHVVKELSKVMALNGIVEQCLREYAVLRTYNNRGLLESETEWPDGKTTTHKYDSMKRLIKKVKPDGVELDYTYDSLGNVETLISSDGTINYAYVHDSHGNLTEVYDNVHHFTQTRHFDLWDRLTWEEISPGIRISYQYDALDRPTKIIFPDQSIVAFTYDPFHLKKTERFDPAGKRLYAVDCEYDLQGNLVQSRSPAGAINISYDLLARAITIRAPHWEASLDKFDAVGNLLQMTQKDPDGTLQGGFAYDRLDHLKFESAFHNQFLYDSIGNCLSKNDHECKINALNQLTAILGSSYSYDPNGNLTSESNPAVRYVYDALNRLIRCEHEDGGATFLYDALDRCIEIQDASGTKKLLYQGRQIGSIMNGRLHEFRLTHPGARTYFCN